MVSDGFSSDFEDGGTSDGELAVGSTATSTTYELRRPLDSGDIHDVRLSKLFRQSDFELRIGMTIPMGHPGGSVRRDHDTEVPTYGGGGKLTAFPAVRITGCPTGDVAMVRVTPPSSTVINLISMPTSSTFVEPLRLSTYDYLGNLVTATCTWQSTSPEVVQVDQQGHVSDRRGDRLFVRGRGLPESCGAAAPGQRADRRELRLGWRRWRPTTTERPEGGMPSGRSCSARDGLQLVVHQRRRRHQLRRRRLLHPRRRRLVARRRLDVDLGVPVDAACPPGSGGR